MGGWLRARVHKAGGGGMLALAALVLAGCQTPVPPVSVTRVHRDAPLPSGTILVEPSPAIAADPHARTYVAAVGQELQRIGFAEVAAPASSRYVATVSYRSTYVSSVRTIAPVPINPSTPPTRPKGTVITDLAVEIRRAGDPTLLWSGSARVRAKESAPAAQPGIAALKLAKAMFSGYPGTSGQTIVVP